MCVHLSCERARVRTQIRVLGAIPQLQSDDDSRFHFNMYAKQNPLIALTNHTPICRRLPLTIATEHSTKTHSLE